MSAKKRMISAAVALLSGGGCVVGPNYKTPTTCMPDAYSTFPTSQPVTQPTAGAPVDLTRWWRALNDPQIDRLVDCAVQSNLDVRIALARLQEARAGEYVVSGGTLPLVDLAAGAGGGTGSDITRGRIPGPLHSASNTSGYKEITEVGGLDAAWEIDLFGQFTREVEAARADTQAAAEARNQVLTTVIADVVRAYVILRTEQLRLVIALDNIHSEEQVFDLVNTRFKQGMTNELDVELSHRQLATVQAQVEPLRASIAQAQSRLEVLLGNSAQTVLVETSSANIPSANEQIRAGLPVELLRRRPDIRQAERELAASTARVGVATADLFPRVDLFGAYGVQGQGLGRTPVQEKAIWSIGPAAYWPVLDFGVLDAVLEVQDFRTQELLLNYRRTVLLAVEEVDDAIANYTADREEVARLGEAVAASQRSVHLANQRYDRGLTDFLNVLDAQRQLYDLQDQYALAQESSVMQYVTLYQALGGGWEHFRSIPAIRKPQPTVIAAGAAVLGTPQPKKSDEGDESN
jgi:NodT family efflux transporter outer membrane factor (OMF) lipoprotein